MLLRNTGGKKQVKHLKCMFLLLFLYFYILSNINFVIILLSQTVVRTLSRQPFFYTVRYSFPLFCTFPGNRKTRRTEVLRVSYVWTQSYLAITLYIIYLLISDYSMIVATRPDPTVRPPSRIAKVRPWLIAIGWISSIVISMLSPGMHISTPSGRLQTPVTSVVLK